MVVRCCFRQLKLVAERRSELKKLEKELAASPETYQRHMHLPPYVLKDENWSRIQMRLPEILKCNKHHSPKNLDLLFERTELERNTAGLVGHSAALRSLAMAKRAEGSVNHFGQVLALPFPGHADRARTDILRERANPLH